MTPHSCLDPNFQIAGAGSCQSREPGGRARGGRLGQRGGHPGHPHEARPGDSESLVSAVK